MSGSLDQAKGLSLSSFSDTNYAQWLSGGSRHKVFFCEHRKSSSIRDKCIVAPWRGTVCADSIAAIVDRSLSASHVGEAWSSERDKGWKAALRWLYVQNTSERCPVVLIML